MSAELILVGTPISPYVRKVLIALKLKGLDFKCIPQVPFYPTEEFKELSPLGRVPVLKHGDLVVPDSSVILQYLEDLCPTPSIYPQAIDDRAKARWLEEYADTELGRNAVFNLFFQKVVRPLVLKEPSDEALIELAISEQLPACLSYLESYAPEEGYLFGDISVADISLTAMLLNAFFAGWQLDDNRWPRFSAYLKRVYEHPIVAACNATALEMTKQSHRKHQHTVDAFIAG